MTTIQSIDVAPHPLLDAKAFVSQLPSPVASSAELLQLLDANAASEFQTTDEIRKHVRDLLRQGGFKPTGRSKPASEYLVKAATTDRLGSINLPVDACNAVSLHSGLPISVIDLDVTVPPLRIAIAEKGASYIFNQSGQSIDIGGLLCLFDAEGPCANAVKDSQRTKTHPQTQRTLSVVWGTVALPGRTSSVTKWYREVLKQAGASTEDIELQSVLD